MQYICNNILDPVTSMFCNRTFTPYDTHEGLEEALWSTSKGKHLDPGLNTVYGKDHKPKAGSPEPTTEHGWKDSCQYKNRRT